jgi:dephospho-CoA kinase
VKNFYLIGLTGNLGSGKSTVRKMLEQLGAFGVDADALAHVVMQPGSPTWHAIVGVFGTDILHFNGKIDRQKLGARVFADADALRRLEALVHPAVEALLKEILREAQAPVVVIEAIKLVEAGLHLKCDALWVVTCTPEVAVQRVTRGRQMSAEDARARLAAQGPQDEKLRLANVILDNSGDENTTRLQAQNAWKNTVRPDTACDKSEWLFGMPRAESVPQAEAAPQTEPQPPAAEIKTALEPTPEPAPSLEDAEGSSQRKIAESMVVDVRRARRSDLSALGVALAKRENRSEPLPRAEAVKRFGERGYCIAVGEQRIIALAAWEAENLVATMRDVWAESADLAPCALPPLFALIEQEADTLQCEVVLILLDAAAPVFVAEQARVCGYQPRELKALHHVWRQVVEEQSPVGDQIWMKRLREEIITKPV